VVFFGIHHKLRIFYAKSSSPSNAISDFFVVVDLPLNLFSFALYPVSVEQLVEPLRLLWPVLYRVVSEPGRTT
jgi:hypothetical protein